MGIQNVRPKKREIVSKDHAYADVIGVLLRDNRTLVIRYYNDHDFTYCSPVRTAPPSPAPVPARHSPTGTPTTGRVADRNGNHAARECGARHQQDQT